MCMTTSREVPPTQTVTARAVRGRRNKRLQALATARRLALETDRVARDRRIDAAVADVLAAREARTEAMNRVAAADAAATDALRQLRDEGVSLTTAAGLCGLSTAALRRLLNDSRTSPPNGGPTAPEESASSDGAEN
jgi:hypothetical protein